jgi:hypothetical protein
MLHNSVGVQDPSLVNFAMSKNSTMKKTRIFNNLQKQSRTNLVGHTENWAKGTGRRSLPRSEPSRCWWRREWASCLQLHVDRDGVNQAELVGRPARRAEHRMGYSYLLQRWSESKLRSIQGRSSSVAQPPAVTSPSRRPSRRPATGRHVARPAAGRNVAQPPASRRPPADRA